MRRKISLGLGPVQSFGPELKMSHEGGSSVAVELDVPRSAKSRGVIVVAR